MSQLLTPRWFEIRKGLYNIPNKKLISDLKQRKFYHTTIVAGGGVRSKRNGSGKGI